MKTQRKRDIMEFQSDGGGEFVNNAFRSHLDECGIVFRKSNRDEPRQNGSERVGQTIVDAGLSMLNKAKNMSLSDWPFAIQCAEQIYSKLPSKRNGGRSPGEIDTGNKSDLSDTRVFGCDAL